MNGGGLKIIIGLIWFLVAGKITLFWLWLWQLKEYHIGRFRAHFRKRGLAKAAQSFLSFRVPVFTKKIFLITIFCLAAEAIFIHYFSKQILLLALVIILLPIFVSFAVFVFQIPTKIAKIFIIKKAKKKIEARDDLLTIGITGSYGKTATKEFLHLFLSKKFNVLKTPQHTNSEIGVAKVVLKNLRAEHKIFVCEIGAYEGGKIAEVMKIVKPKIGILTGINEQHLATFGSQKNIMEGKFEIIKNLPEEGKGYFNGENSLCKELFEKTKLKNKKLVYADRGFQKFAPWERENLALARVAAFDLGVETETIERAAEEIFPKKWLKKSRQGTDVFESIYSGNPQSVISHLDYLKKWQGNKVIVIRCLIELGSAGERIHQKIGEKIAEVCDLAVITTSEYFPEIKRASFRKNFKNVFLIKKSEKIYKKIKPYLKENSVVLLENRIPKKLLTYLYGDKENKK